MKDAQYWIERLELKPHPEGGHYRQTYVSEDVVPSGLIERYEGPRPCSTAIYFLLSGHEVSHLHRIKSDEMWHFYAGTGLLIHVLYPNGDHSVHRLDAADTGMPQIVVPRGCWFGAEVPDGQGYSLVGCTVSPGFDFRDFELANPDKLRPGYPQALEIIRRLT